MIVDAHMHIWNHIDGRIGEDRTRASKDGRVFIGGREIQMTPPGFTDSLVTAERAAAYFDGAGVDVGVVVQEYMDGSQNEYLLDVQQHFPDRFFCHALIDFYSAEACAAEFEKVKAQGFKGVKLPAGHLFAAEPRVPLNRPDMMRVYEAMEAEGMVLAVDLAEGAAQVEETRGIAQTFPDLKIALGHFAMANRPEWLDQLRLARLPNVYVESGGICWLFRDEGPPFPGAQKAIETARNEVGADKLMWGSDLPRTMVDFTYRQLLDFARYECAFFTAAEKDGFLGENAARLYQLKPPAAKREPYPLITE